METVIDVIQWLALIIVVDILIGVGHKVYKAATRSKKPKLILRFGDREVESDFSPYGMKNEAHLRSPRLFKKGDDDKSVIFYSDMTPQEKHDAGFRKVK